MCIKLCLRGLQFHTAEVVPLGHPHLHLQGDQNKHVKQVKHVKQAKHVPPHPPGETTSCPASCTSAPFGALHSNLRTAVLDKLGRLTKCHFSVNCRNVHEHRLRAKRLIAYSYRLIEFYTIISKQLQQNKILSKTFEIACHLRLVVFKTNVSMQLRQNIVLSP